MIGDETSGSVATIEHILSALHGLGIDNALIEIDGPEVPIVDGSAWPFVEAIESVGVVELQRSRRVLKVLKHVRVDIGSAFAELRPSASGFSLDVEIDFASPVIGRQRWAMNLNPECYRRDVAKARTFGFMKDVQRLWQAGYARGANLDNTVAVDEDRVVNPGGLRFRDEFVRHKLLDAVGDLALAGRSIVGAFRSYCSGHRLNIMVLQALFADRHAYELIDSPHYSGRPQASHDALLPQAAYAPERF
jgi:UDP-3-O-[3-hydroxymyristoyl] N-acetylglucosamine deacetylase